MHGPWSLVLQRWPLRAYNSTMLPVLPPPPPRYMFAIEDVLSQILVPASVPACCHGSPPWWLFFFTLKSEAQINSSLHKLALVIVFLA